MLTIRLQRAGKKNKADFRLVLAQKTAASQKKFVEVLGSYNPHTKNLQIRDEARLNYWIDEQHAEVSPTAYNLLVAKEIVKGDKKKAFTIPKKEVVAEEVKEVASAESTDAAPVEESVETETVAEADAPVKEETTTEVSVPEPTPVETPVEVTSEAVSEQEADHKQEVAS